MQDAKSFASSKLNNKKPGGNQAHVQEFVEQLNKTEEALLKYRRAASNYRANAYRIEAIGEVEERSLDLKAEPQGSEAMKSSGKYPYASKSLPRYVHRGGPSAYASQNDYSLDLVNQSVHSMQHKRQLENIGNAANVQPGQHSFKAKTLASVDLDNLSSRLQKHSPDFIMSLAPSNAAEQGSTNPTVHYKVDPRSLPNTSYGSKE